MSINSYFKYKWTKCLNQRQKEAGRPIKQDLSFLKVYNADLKYT